MSEIGAIAWPWLIFCGLRLVRSLREKMTGAGKDVLIFWTLKSLSTKGGGMGEYNRYWGGQVLLEPYSGPDKERKWVPFLFPNLLGLFSSGERVRCYWDRRLTLYCPREAASNDQRINLRGFPRMGQNLLLLYQVDGSVRIRADHLKTICLLLLLGPYLGSSP